MVWGLLDPNGFGDFFPEGDFLNYDEQLKKYFDEELSPEQRAEHDNWHVSYAEVVSRKFTQDLGPLAPHERPLEYKLNETYKSLASLIILPNRLLAVDAELKEIIEKLEPGIHQLWPLRITTRKGEEYPATYFGLIVRTFLDSFAPEQSGNLTDDDTSSNCFFSLHPKKTEMAKLAMAKHVHSGCHLWRERKLLRPELFMSDALQEKISERGLRIFRHYKLKDI